VLNAEQQTLVNQMRQMGRRWMISYPTSVSRPMAQVMAAWLNAQAATPVGGVGAVIGPASLMHNWWAAGWQGLHLSNVKFTKLEVTEAGRIVSVVFDEMHSYSHSYLDKLDEFLTKDGDYALFRLPNPFPPQEPGGLRLREILLKHNFRLLNINPT
jgi:hypothetical protein